MSYGALEEDVGEWLIEIVQSLLQQTTDDTTMQEKIGDGQMMIAAIAQEEK